MIEKNIVFPRVVIYPKLLNNVESVLNLIKDSESYTEQKHLLSTWNEWDGNWSGMATQIDGARHRSTLLSSKDASDQIDFFQNIFKAFDAAREDFMTEYSGYGQWPDYINNWNMLDNKIWNEAGISILKYDKPKADQTNDDLAMNYHTDTNQEDLDSPGHKLTVTITMYLNDDYEGGEISFYDSVENKVFNYKPQAGDVTVFPSFAPYYHGVLPFKGNSRYLLRMFITYYSPGSKTWIDNLNKYGEDEWLRLEKERLSIGYNNGSNLIHISYGEDANVHPKFKTFNVKSSPVWIK